MTHSIYAPSSAARWVECHGSVALEQLFPELEESDAAAEGTAAHWIASELLVERDPANTTHAPNGVELTEEMRDAADLFVETVRATVEVPWPEFRVKIPRVHADCFGTVDAFTWDSLNGVLRVYDFKFGRVFVEAYENWQLIAYACGLLDHIGVPDEHVRVELTVVQPRAYSRGGPVRTWRVRATDLRPYVNQLAYAAGMATQDTATVKTGPHCTNCRARHACPAAERASWAAFEYSTLMATHDLTNAAIGYERNTLQRAIETLEARCSGLDAEIEARIKGGAQVPGWALATAYGRTKWAEGKEAEVLMMGDLLGVDLRQPEKPITPKQAEKMIDKAVIQPYSVTPSTGVKLVTDKNLLITAQAAFGVENHG